MFQKAPSDTNSRHSFDTVVTATHDKDIRNFGSGAPYLSTKSDSYRGGGVCSGLSNVLGLHYLFNYRPGTDSHVNNPVGVGEQFFRDYERIVIKLKEQEGKEYVNYVQDHSRCIKDLLGDTAQVVQESLGLNDLVHKVPEHFYDTKGSWTILTPEVMTDIVRHVYDYNHSRGIDPAAYGYVAVSYTIIEVDIDKLRKLKQGSKAGINYDIEECEILEKKKLDKKNENALCRVGGHRVALIFTETFMIFHDSNLKEHRVFGIKKDKLNNVYHSFEERMTRYWKNTAFAASQETVMDYVAFCVKKSISNLRECVDALVKEFEFEEKPKGKVVFYIGNHGDEVKEEMLTNLKQQHKFNNEVQSEVQKLATTGKEHLLFDCKTIVKVVTKDISHRTQKGSGPITTLIKGFTRAKVSREIMWKAREHIRDVYTKEDFAMVSILSCIATSSGTIAFGDATDDKHEEHSNISLIQTFDFLLLAFFPKDNALSSVQTREKFCEKFKNEYTIHICEYNKLDDFTGKLLPMYEKLSTGKMPKNSKILKQQLTQDFQKFEKCYKTGERDENFHQFLSTVVIKLVKSIPEIFLKVNKLVDENISNPAVPVSYPPSLVTSALENRNMDKEGSHTFMGYSLFRTFVSPILFSYFPRKEDINIDFDYGAWIMFGRTIVYQRRSQRCLQRGSLRCDKPPELVKQIALSCEAKDLLGLLSKRRNLEGAFTKVDNGILESAVQALSGDLKDYASKTTSIVKATFQGILSFCSYKDQMQLKSATITVEGILKNLMGAQPDITLFAHVFEKSYDLFKKQTGDFDTSRGETCFEILEPHSAWEYLYGLTHYLSLLRTYEINPGNEDTLCSKPNLYAVESQPSFSHTKDAIEVKGLLKQIQHSKNVEKEMQGHEDSGSTPCKNACIQDARGKFASPFLRGYQCNKIWVLVENHDMTLPGKVTSSLRKTLEKDDEKKDKTEHHQTSQVAEEVEELVDTRVKKKKPIESIEKDDEMEVSLSGRKSIASYKSFTSQQSSVTKYKDLLDVSYGICRSWCKQACNRKLKDVKVEKGGSLGKGYLAGISCVCRVLLSLLYETGRTEITKESNIKKA
eukprot:Nk52_evm10s2402 gene=Nk52_evmTU10s2402